MLTVRLCQTFVFLASCALATSAYASYGQMRLDGLGLLLAFVISFSYGVLVDVLLLAKLFRHRAVVVVGSIVSLAVVVLLLSQADSPSERTGFFKGAPGGAALVVMVVTSAVFLPFILIAPFAQYLSMRHDQRWPRWISAWMVLQAALLPGFLVLAGTEEYFWQREFTEGEAAGREVKAGGLSGTLARADQRRERIWGTGWTYPWKFESPARSYPQSSAWSYGVGKSMDASALMAASEPLSAPDRAALNALMARHFGAYAFPNTRAKLLWDALEPGGFAKELAPQGVNEVGSLGDEMVPVLLDRLEKHAEPRLCPDGQMMDADRAVLNALVVAKGRVWNREKRVDEMRPQWAGYPQRVERLCRGKPTPAA